MATGNEIATMSRTRLIAGLRSVRSRLSSIREAAEVGAQRLTIGAAAAGGGYVVGRVIGNYARDGKDLTVGDSEINWTLPIAGALMLGGAFMGKALGETTANVAFGLGTGGVAGELALIGQKHGLAPADA